MKIRPSLRFFALGVFITFVCAIVAMRANNLRWQCEAYDHCAAVWTTNFQTGESKWMWLDDYFSDRLKEIAHATPTPNPDRL